MVSTSKFTRPLSDEYHEYYEGYISKVDSKRFMEIFEGQPRLLNELLGSLPDGEDSKLHEPYTWTLKQVVGHMIDCERIFSTRLLRIAAADDAPIPGIDQNQYVSNLNYNDVTMGSLLNEFEHLREANIELVNRLTADSLENIGTASNNPASARANLYILVGHVIHHMEIMKTRVG